MKDNLQQAKEKEAVQKKVDQALPEVQAVLDKYGLELSAQLDASPYGIIPVPSFRARILPEEKVKEDKEDVTVLD